MADRKNRVCPVSLAGSLDNRLRRWVQDPWKILRPYIKEGMTVLDLGCGPGYFTLDIAQMVGGTGRVIAADLQEGMLRKVRHKLHGTELEGRVALHKCEKHSIGLSEPVDFILAFYMVHEIDDRESLLRELESILKPEGRLFIVEPTLHVSKSAFEETVRKAHGAGLKVVHRPKMFLSKTALLKKA